MKDEELLRILYSICNKTVGVQLASEFLGAAWEGWSRARARWNGETKIVTFCTHRARGAVLDERRRNDGRKGSRRNKAMTKKRSLDFVIYDDEVGCGITVGALLESGDVKVLTTLEIKEEVEAVLASLSARKRAILVDLYINGLTRQETARRQDLSESRLSQLLREIREELNE